MIEATVSPRSPRRDRAFWQAHTDQWKHSGLSKIAYAKKNELKPISFYNWSKKLDNTDLNPKSVPSSPATFLPVQIDQGAGKACNASPCIRVECAAVDIALPVDLSSEQIRRWLHAIHTLHA